MRILARGAVGALRERYEANCIWQVHPHGT